MGEETSTSVEVNTDYTPPKFFRINKSLLLLKSTLFFLHGATSSLVPYLTIHMQSIGLSMEQIAIIYLCLPFTTFLAPPATGYLVDKFGKYKPVVIGCFILTAILHHSLLFMPHQETPGTVPSGYIIRHPKKMYVEVWWSPCPSRECPDDEELDIALEFCMDHCLLKEAKLLKNKKLIKTNLTKKPCKDEDPGDKDDLNFHIKKKQRNDTATAFTLDMHPKLGEPVEQFGIEIEDEDDEDVTDFKKRFRLGMLKRHGVDINELETKDLRCGGIVLAANVTTRSLLRNYTDDCILQKCQFRSGGPKVCPPDYKQAEPMIFWIYGGLRFLATMMQLAATTIMDPVALSMIEKHGGDFGKERLFSCFGMAIFAPITGALIDWYSQRVGHTDYSLAFYSFDFLLIIASLSLFFMPLDAKLPSDNMLSDLKKILKMPALMMVVFFLFLLGNLWGFIESFLFFYLKDLGAPNYLLGITVTVGTISSVPFLYGSDKITGTIGHVSVVILAFFAHATRLVGYSLIESPWWCFPFEALESIAVHLMWVAAATYCAVLAPRGLLATLLGVCAVAHYSVGRGSGSFIGGHIIAKFGITTAFRIMGMFAVCSGLSYAFLNLVWLRKVEKRAQDRREAEVTEELKGGGLKYKDQGTMMSLERLTVMIDQNHIGSITSLGRHSRSGIIRRGSLSAARPSIPNARTELLKSANEINQHRARQNSERDGSARQIYPSLSIQGVNGSVLCEKEEIVYDEIKRKAQSYSSEKDETLYDEIKKKPENNSQDDKSDSEKL
ncbi:major facilitator superfamily domain-containing protein 6-like [Diabrotica undecimpunctata]|uniref:major facilitator superfamily domain-containing protein 6-like n=1 Tax=Diabrotica undecimpunctata TaxID=50387 RepID=UPI003B639347